MVCLPFLSLPLGSGRSITRILMFITEMNSSTPLIYCYTVLEV
jgi:hypothetical protein